MRRQNLPILCGSEARHLLYDHYERFFDGVLDVTVRYLLAGETEHWIDDGNDAWVNDDAMENGKGVKCSDEFKVLESFWEVVRSV